ncbi:NUDIX domain-containing protein [Streptomyces mobaraensis]|uniref:NUDIX domain-containing protein n=1 Tax=Streptomyces mobaraensis TaxID=35621 RepID=UPI0013E05E11|nr:NUDIX hydrolase [Streptomyces mobaraensis]
MAKHPQYPRAEWLARRTRILASASSLVHDAGGRILLLHCSWADVWQFPGGTQDSGEDLWQTAVRETLEETGLAMPPRPRLLAVDWSTHPEGIDECWALFQGPLIDPGIAEIALSDEHDRWRMLAPGQWAPHLPAGQAHTLAVAHDALVGGQCAYLRNGSPFKGIL